MYYRREIDGLRALAVLSVIFFHAGFKIFSGGFVGVDVFFVISGYLITSIILSEKKAGSFKFLNFYERRARRILPALFAVILFCLPFAWFFLLPTDLERFSKSLMAVSSFISNIFFWSERGYFDAATGLKPLAHTWSLGVEEQYYIVFPIILFLISRYSTKEILFASTAALISFAMCIWVTKIHVDTAFYFLPTRFWELLVGSIVAMVMFQDQLKTRDGDLRETIYYFFSAIGLLLIIIPMFIYNESIAFPGYYAFFPVLGTAFVIYFTKKDSYLEKILGSNILVFIGLISYSAYLLHQPIFAFSRQIIPNSGNAFFLILIFITFLLAFLNWKYIESSFRDRSKYSTKTVFFFSALGLIFVFMIGALGVKTKGGIFRFNDNDRALFESIRGASEYVAYRFDALKLKDFKAGDSKNKKIMLIGDSYGKDLLNAIYESGLIAHLDISTYQINSECGNLYLEHDFIAKIEPSKVSRCVFMNWYNNPRLQKLIKDSDEIWLASSWQDWVVDLLPESVMNLEKQFKKKVVVFGSKNFGVIDIKKILKESPEFRYRSLNPLKMEFSALNEKMRLRFGSDIFIDLSKLLCDGDAVCKIFNENKELLSFDGGHLTKAGAVFLGKKFVDNCII